MVLTLSSWIKRRWKIFYDALSYDWKLILHGPSEATEAFKFMQLHRYEPAESASLRSVNQLQREGTTECLEGHILNLVVNQFITAGRYQAALACTDYLIERYENCSAARILLINRAEALHNLGRSEEGLLLLDSIESKIEDKLCANGLNCLRAWILLGNNQVDAAEPFLDSIDSSALLEYLAEIGFTKAAYLQAKGNFSEALKHANQGYLHAKRPSSSRNGLIMRASIHSDLGEYSEAIWLFDEAAALEYRGQAAYGLLRLGLLELRQRGAHAKGEKVALQRSDLSENLQKQWEMYDPESQLTLMTSL